MDTGAYECVVCCLFVEYECERGFPARGVVHIVSCVTHTPTSALTAHLFACVCRWCEPNMNTLREHMRFVHENKEEAAAVGAKAREKIVSQFSRETAAAAVKDRLQEIANMLVAAE